MLDENVSSKFEDGLKYRNHPGKRHNSCSALPPKLQLAVDSILNSMSMPIERSSTFHFNFQQNIEANDFVKVSTK